MCARTLLDLRSSCDSLTASLNTATQRILDRDLLAWRTACALNEALPPPSLSPDARLALRASEQAARVTADIVEGHDAQFALLQSAVRAALPQSCVDAWQEYCVQRQTVAAAATAAVTSASSATIQVSDTSSGATESTNAPRNDAESYPPCAACRDDATIFRMHAAAEDDRERLVAIAATVAVQPMLRIRGSAPVGSDDRRILTDAMDTLRFVAELDVLSRDHASAGGNAVL